jgi:hypothetical protein
MFDTGVKARAHLAKLGIDLSGDQQTKTKTALEFYSAALRAQASSGSTNGASTNGASANGASTNGAKPASTARRRTTTSRAATSRKTAAKR